jgi:phage gp29-like protein
MIDSNIIEERNEIAIDLMANRMKMDRGFMKRFSSFLPNNNSILQKAKKDMKDLREVKLDPQVSSAFEARKNNILKLKNEVDRGTEVNFYATWIKNIMKDWDLPQLMSDIIDARGFGFAVFEYHWQRQDNFVIIKNLANLPADYFQFDYNGRLFFKNMNYDTSKVCSNYNYLLVQNKATQENPYGEALLANCFWPVTFKKGGIKFWAQFVEKYGSPMLHGSTLAPDKSKLVEALSELRNGGVAVSADGDNINLLKGNEKASADIYNQFIAFQNSEISKVLLSHSSAMDATAGELGNTNKAQSSIDIIALSDKRFVEQTIQKAINVMIEVNFGREVVPPPFELYEEEDVDMNLALLAESLTKSGAKFNKSFFIESFGFKNTDLEVGPAPIPPMFSEAANKDYLDKIDSSLHKYVDLVKNGSSYSDIKKSLITEFSQNTDSEIEKILSDIILASELQAKQDENDLQNNNFSMFNKFRRFFKWN